MTDSSHAEAFFEQAAEICRTIDTTIVEQIADGLVRVRENGGRLFLLGVGGSAANCSHAVNDFRKLAGIETYSPCDNVSELTARTNDEGWDTVFSEWLKVSKANDRDAVLVMSVGGGSIERNVSANICHALDEAKRRGTAIYGITGRDGGYTKQVGDAVVVVPTVDESHITPLSESFQAVVWHCVVSHPKVLARSTKWEGIDALPNAA